MPSHPDESVTPSMDKDLYYALTEADIQRVHTTLTIDDFDCITEDVRYIFYNNGTTQISVLPLPAIKRNVQRNMKVEDFRMRKLVFIPSSSSAGILVNASTRILDTADHLLQQPQKDTFTEIKDAIQSTLPEVFKYGPEQQYINSACEQIAKIQEKRNFWTEPFIREIIILANLFIQYRNGFYLPLITLAEPLQPKSYTLIHLSVEIRRGYLQDRITRVKFNLLGGFTFSFVPEIYSGISNHVRIYAPEGLVIKEVEFDLQPEHSKDPESKKGVCKGLQKHLDEHKRDYFDDRCFYIQLGPEKSTILYHCKKYFNIKLGLSSLLKTLLWLWWLTVLSPFICGVLSWLKILPLVVARVVFSSDFALALLALSATFLVAAFFYAIDKKIVKQFITTHIIFIYVVLTVEIFFMMYN
ncbi:MAG: hypothetical protein HXS48_26370 [Theionarchaea archaeon]|nr:hypothetical protein [Theionarchaea archaeon]